MGSPSAPALILGLCVIMSLAPPLHAEEIVGVGGLVGVAQAITKFKPKQKIDFSKVTVRLHTQEGLLKSSTECAPNGYYFIRIYDKGQFYVTVQGPEGWSITPQRSELQIGESTHAIQDDVNFVLSGFAVSGKVWSRASSAGPPGVTVTLLQGEEVVGVTNTTAGGAYKFSALPPGKYALQATHSDWTIENHSTSFEFNWGNQEIDHRFLITGYEVRGRVLTAGEALAGVSLLLYSADKTPQKLKCKQEAQKPKSLPSPLCSVVSPSNGEFAFTNVPPGEYIVRPHYESALSLFKVEPAELRFTLAHGSMMLDRVFEVLGFSVFGKVLHPSGRGVQGVTISVAGDPKAVTSETGYYALEQLTAGEYDVVASQEHLVFNQLPAKLKIAPSTAQLEDIVVSKYSLCGVLDLGDQAGQAATIALEQNGERIDSTQASGEFCFSVVPGEYTVVPVTTPNDRAAGLILAPPSSGPVVITDHPVLNISFSKAKVSVSGTVECIESPCDPSISVTLVTEGHSDRRITDVTSRNGQNVFEFKDVLPGQHRVSVNQDAWCWEQQIVSLEVSTEPITGVLFKQSGYILNAILSHDIDLGFSLEKKKNGGEAAEHTFKMTKGSQNFCLSKPGMYKITPRSCYLFLQDVYQYDTSAPRVLDFEATHFKVTGTVETANKTESDITVQVVQKGANAAQGEPKLLKAVLSSSSNDTEGGQTHVYTYIYWATLGESVELVPAHESWMFYPRSRGAAVIRNECPVPLEAIQAREGVQVEGEVVPPLDGVSITVLDEATNKVMTSVSTSKNGKYTAGPLYDDQAYKLKAHKEGFNFKHEGKGVFRAIQLSQTTIEVKDHEGKPVEGVLLSLTGDQYRNHSATDASGKFTFADLFSGEYHLRPLLKEYTFEPAPLNIEITEGEIKTFSLTATRVSYSCFGSVRSLNGAPEKHVVVEAVGEGEHEQTVGDANGRFRLRGLIPGHNYSVRVVKGGESDAPIERTMPAVESFTMQAKDHRGLLFVIFREMTRFDLTGVVSTTAAELDTLEVQLAHADKINEVFKSTKLPLSGFFEFSDLAEGEYTVSLRSTRTIIEKDKWEVKASSASVSLGVNAPKRLKPLELTFDSSRKVTHEDIQTSSFGMFLVVATLVFAMVNSDVTLHVITVLISARGRRSAR